MNNTSLLTVSAIADTITQAGIPFKDDLTAVICLPKLVTSELLPQHSLSTLDKTSELVRLELVIKNGCMGLVAIGNALSEIRDQGLYKLEFVSFDEYCTKKWGFKKSYAYQLIASAEAAKSVSAIIDISTESHARELAKVPKKKRVSVVKIALAAAELAKRSITAKDLKKAANTQSTTITKPATAQTIGEQLRALWPKASVKEQKAFLSWIKTNKPSLDKFVCNACEEKFESTEECVAYYECSDCNEYFTQYTSANSNHQCPSCNKFGSKVSNLGCSECNEGEVEPIEADDAQN